MGPCKSYPHWTVRHLRPRCLLMEPQKIGMKMGSSTKWHLPYNPLNSSKVCVVCMHVFLALFDPWRA